MIKRAEQCPHCGLYDCAWTAGPYCEGNARTKALQAFAPEWRHLPWWKKWLARIRSQHIVELECENEYFRKWMKGQYDDIRLVDVNIKPEEFQFLLRSGIGGILASWMLQAIRSIGAKAYVEVMGEHPQEGKLTFTVARIGGEAPGARAARYENIIRSYVSPRPYSEWNEEIGAVVWWHFNEAGRVTEPPWIGTPLDLGQTVEGVMRHHVGGTGEVKEIVNRTDVGGWPGYHTHFTRIPVASMNWAPPAPPA